MEQAALINLYNQQADKYSRLRKKKRSFDHTWIKKLLSLAKGHILEVSVGAGANFKFYSSDSEVTAVDISPDMIDKAREAAHESHILAKLMMSDVESLDFPAQSFDTIVSTLSLCAYADPVKVLNLFNHWCKKDGIILLMEHGLSKSRFIQWFQHKLDKFQYRKIGCHANRDMAELVKDSQLSVDMMERKLFGIMYLIRARPGDA